METTRLRVTINGEAKELDEGATLLALVEGLSLAPERVAAELNGEVVRRAEWGRVKMKEGDRVEIVHFVGGG
jgi:thiamine biosynthesis protein ThiS